MIHEIKEEIYISVYLILFGIYILSSYDVIQSIKNRIIKNKVVSIIIELIYFIGQTILTYYFSYYLASGYIPIYFILFIFIGITIYYKVLKKPFVTLITIIIDKIVKIIIFIWKYFIHLLYSKTLFKYIKSIYKTIKRNVIKYKKTKNNKKEKISLD